MDVPRIEQARPSLCWCGRSPFEQARHGSRPAMLHTRNFCHVCCNSFLYTGRHALQYARAAISDASLKHEDGDLLKAHRSIPGTGTGQRFRQPKCVV